MSKLSAIGGAVVSVVSTTAGLIGDTRALLYTDKDFARLYTMMKGQAVEYADLHKKISPAMEQQQTRREIILDVLQNDSVLQKMRKFAKKYANG